MDGPHKYSEQMFGRDSGDRQARNPGIPCNAVQMPRAASYPLSAVTTQPDSGRRNPWSNGVREETSGICPKPLDALSRPWLDTYMTNTTAAQSASRTGSNLVSALENLYASIRTRHAELPEHVVFVTGSGLDARGVVWGHFRPEGWTPTPPVLTKNVAGLNLKYRLIKSGRMPEIFISGERIECGAELVLQTVLHECAHGLGHIRKVVNTNGGRHLKSFVTLAEEMGLTYPNAKADAQLGFSAVVLTDETKAAYAAELAELDAALSAHMDTLKRLGMLVGGTLTGGTDGGDGFRGMKAPRQGKDRNYIACRCQCEPPRTVRMSAKTLAEAPVLCGVCREDFEPAG